MKKVWLKNYQQGVPEEISVDHTSLVDLFEKLCQQYKKHAAFENFGTTITYLELEEKSQAFASYLQHQLKAEKGDRIALMMPNLLQYPIALFGALRAGLVVVNINPLCKPRELKNYLKDSGAKTIVILSHFISTLDEVASVVEIDSVIVTNVGDCFPFLKRSILYGVLRYIKKEIPKKIQLPYVSFRDVLHQGKNKALIPVRLEAIDKAFFQYTGGTTGLSKGAILTHANMLANIEQAASWISPAIEEGKEIVITALPLYHIFSLLANCLTFMRVGGLNVLITNPRDIKGFVQTLSRHSFTAITGVNTLFKALLNNTTFCAFRFTKLKITLAGGMAVQHVVAERWHEVTKVPLLEAYGLTEASPAVCINPMSLQHYNGSVGLPISSTDIEIRDDSGQVLSFNQEGELWVRGPQVMQGYWQKKQDTQEVLQEGWLRTGDIATIDEEGFVRIIDRKKDMIIVSGFNVYPNEVEDVIAELKGVAEVAVVGVSLEGKEQVKAFIVKRDPNLTEEAVMIYCREQLSNYKIPYAIEFREELPKSAVGKILRRALKE